MWAVPLVFVKEDQGFTVAAIGILIMITSVARGAGARGAGARRVGERGRGEVAAGTVPRTSTGSGPVSLRAGGAPGAGAGAAIGHPGSPKPRIALGPAG